MHTLSSPCCWQIVPLEQSHYPHWKTLLEGYATFYQRNITCQIEHNLWEWLLDPHHPLVGRVAKNGEKLAGFMHFRAMPSPLRGGNIGFLDDLYVASHYRKQGIARLLLMHLRDYANSEGWEIVRWITDKNNHQARKLYDQYANNTNWRVYEMVSNA